MHRATGQFRGHRWLQASCGFGCSQNIGIAFRIGRGQTQTHEQDRETNIGRLSKRPVEQGEETRRKKKDRQYAAEPKLQESEVEDPKSKRESPEDKRQTQKRPAFEQNARIFIFRQEKPRAAGKEPRAAICTYSQSVSENRHAVDDFETFKVPFEGFEVKAIRQRSTSQLPVPTR